MYDFVSVFVPEIFEEKMKERKKQYRFPRSKNRRIRKKWAKNPKNYKVFCNGK